MIFSWIKYLSNNNDLYFTGGLRGSNQSMKSVRSSSRRHDMDDLAFASLGMPQQPLGGGHPSGTLTSGYNSGHTSGHVTPGGHMQVPLQQQVLQQQFQQQHQAPPVHYRQPQPLPTYDNNME